MIAPTGPSLFKLTAIHYSRITTVLCILVATGIAPTFAQDYAYGPASPDAPASVLEVPVGIPESLNRAAAIAAQTHPLVGAVEAEGQALEAELRGARWRRFPNLTVEVLAVTKGNSLIDSNGIAANLVLEQPIWAGGRIDAEIDQARANLAAGQNRVGEAERDIILEVTSAYYDYVLAVARANVLVQSLHQHRKLLDSINRRVEREVSPLIDYTLGRSRTAQVELDLASVRELQERARARLLELTGGVDVGPVLPTVGVDDMLPPEGLALSEALACSPTLATLTHLVDVAEAQKRATRGRILPQLLFQLSQNENTGARAAIVFRAQTGNGLSQLAALDSTNARIQRALAEFGDAERHLRERLRREYILSRTARQRIEFGVLAADTSEEIIASYRRQFIAGRRSWLDVMNAVREAANARLSEEGARVAAAASTARILALTCRWDPVVGGRGNEHWR